MIRLLWLLALASIACRMLTGQWPWHYLAARSTRSEKLARARRLLGVPLHADRQQIILAHRQLVVEVHPDRGGSNALVHEANAARDLLLDQLSLESGTE